MPVFGVALIWAYLFAIPAIFLIEAETATETGDWPIACRIEDWGLFRARTSAYPDLARAQEAWISSRTAPRIWRLMKGTDCRLENITHRQPAERGNLAAVSAGGAAIFTGTVGAPHKWHLNPITGAATELIPPEGCEALGADPVARWPGGGLARERTPRPDLGMAA